MRRITRRAPLSFAVLLTLVLISPLFLLSCDSSGSGDGNGGGPGDGETDTFSLDKGSSSATIEEDGETHEISGGAVFGVASKIPQLNLGISANSDGESFVIYILAGEKNLDDEGDLFGPYTEIAFSDASATVLEEGQYTLFGEEDVTFSMVEQREGLTILGGPFVVDPGPGELQITSKTSDELQGTFQYETADDSSIDIRVTNGSFTAVRVDNIEELLCAPDCEDS